MVCGQVRLKPGVYLRNLQRFLVVDVEQFCQEMLQTRDDSRPCFISCSVGLENVEDLIKDFEQAFRKI